MDKIGGSGGRVAAVVLAAVWSSSAVAGPKDFSLDAKPVWEGSAPAGSVYPIAWEIGNIGPDAKGVVRVVCNGRAMDYPIELPRGTKKRLLTYPEFGRDGSGQIEVVVVTDQGSVRTTYSPPGSVSQGMAVVALVSDHPGDLQFLAVRQQPGTRRMVEPIKDVYATPGTLPERSIGYEGIGAVVLGDGAERLTDVEVSALKLYVLLGGTLVFKGGASAPSLLDKRWTSVLPVTKPRTVTVSASPFNVSGQITLQQGTAKPGAIEYRSGGVQFSVRKSFGLGKVVVLAYDPFEDPLSKWEGRRNRFVSDTQPNEGLTTAAYLSQFTAGAEDPYGSAYMYGGTRSSYYPTTPGQRDTRDPFSIELPPTERVLWILLAYFVTVVPVNFLILRKLKKGEWAWVTSPLISLGFAGLFFYSARDLYSAGLSSASKGLIISGEGVDNAVLLASTRMFFPQGGSYDLKLTGVERIGSQSIQQREYEYYYHGGGMPEGDPENDLRPVDVGEVKVTNMDVSNLAFRSLTYRQRVSGQNWLSVRQVDARRIEVRNLSPYVMQSVRVCSHGGETAIGLLNPKEARTVELPAAESKKQNNYGEVSMRTLTTYRSGSVVLAVLSAFRPGPQIGKNVESQTAINLAYFTGAERRDVKL